MGMNNVDNESIFASIGLQIGTEGYHGLRAVLCEHGMVKSSSAIS
jgi:hypothetical protein